MRSNFDRFNNNAFSVLRLVIT